MIEQDLLRALGTTHPRMAQHLVGVPRKWLAHVRTIAPSTCPHEWPERLAREHWISADDAQDLLEELGLSLDANLPLLLTCTVPQSVGIFEGNKGDRLKVHDAYPAATVGLALLVLWRLGVQIPVEELLAPLKRRLSRQTLLGLAELHLRRWTSCRERKIVSFFWLVDQEVYDIPDGNECRCQRLHDGRIAIAFHNTSGVPSEVISKPGETSNLQLALNFANAPKKMRWTRKVRDAMSSDPVASSPMISASDAVMEDLHRILAGDGLRRS